MIVLDLTMDRTWRGYTLHHDFGNGERDDGNTPHTRGREPEQPCSPRQKCQVCSHEKLAIFGNIEGPTGTGALDWAWKNGYLRFIMFLLDVVGISVFWLGNQCFLAIKGDSRKRLWLWILIKYSVMDEQSVFTSSVSKRSAEQSTSTSTATGHDKEEEEEEELIVDIESIVVGLDTMESRVD